MTTENAGYLFKMYQQQSSARLAVCASLGGAAQRVSLRDRVSCVVTAKDSDHIPYRHDVLRRTL